MNLGISDLKIVNEVIRDSDNSPIYPWKGYQLEELLTNESFADLMSRKYLDSREFSTNQNLYEIKCTPEEVTLVNTSQRKIILSSSSPDVPLPTVPSNFQSEISRTESLMNQYIQLFRTERNLGFLSSDEGFLMTLYQGIFIPANDTPNYYYGHYLVIETESKFYDLSSYDLEDNSLIMITYSLNHDVIFTDLTPGNDPDLGLIIENKTITSDRLIKRLDIYYENSNSLQS